MDLDSYINEPEPLTESESEESTEENHVLFQTIQKDTHISDTHISNTHNGFDRPTKTLSPTELNEHIEEVYKKF